MKLIKKIVAVMATVACLVCVCVFAACSGEESSSALQNIEASGYIYVAEEQTIAIEGSTYFVGDEPARFKSTVSASDIVLDSNLSGKTVKSVKYVSEEEIEVTLTGNTTTSFEDDKTMCKITVKGTATQNGKNSYCYVYLRKPKLTCISSLSDATGAFRNISATFSLPYGSFNAENATVENVTLVDADNGTVTEVIITKSGNLMVTVEGFTGSFGYSPTIKIAASITSFNKEVTIAMSVFTTAPLY